MKTRIKLPGWRFTCDRCGYVWESTAKAPPVACAKDKCRSPYWDRGPKKEKGQ